MGKKHPLYTSDLAKAVGIHPNTVRLYEQWGFLPPIPRSPTGYRLFSEAHLDQLRLARLALHCTVIGGDVRHTALDMVYCAAQGDLGGALELAYRFISGVQAERSQAEAAAQFLQRWAGGASAEATPHRLHIGEVAGLLNTTIDSLRSWERNGLIDVPRDAQNGYRLYGKDEIGRLRVIRMLIRSGYSSMSILRMLTLLDQGHTDNLRHVLDTPHPEEDALYVSDHWLTTLADAEQTAAQCVALLEQMISKNTLTGATPQTLHKPTRVI